MMEKFIPPEKRSKKKQRELHAGKRGTWGGLNPATRVPANPKAYNRKKARKWSDDSSMTVLSFLPAAAVNAENGSPCGSWQQNIIAKFGNKQYN